MKQSICLNGSLKYVHIMWYNTYKEKAMDNEDEIGKKEIIVLVIIAILCILGASITG